jgi:hypothetical protein
MGNRLRLYLENRDYTDYFISFKPARVHNLNAQ